MEEENEEDEDKEWGQGRRMKHVPASSLLALSEANGPSSLACLVQASLSGIQEAMKAEYASAAGLSLPEERGRRKHIIPGTI